MGVFRIFSVTILGLLLNIIITGHAGMTPACPHTIKTILCKKIGIAEIEKSALSVNIKFNHLKILKQNYIQINYKLENLSQKSNDTAVLKKIGFLLRKLRMNKIWGTIQNDPLNQIPTPQFANKKT